MTVRKPLQVLSTNGDTDKLAEFTDLDTLSSYIFSNDPTGKTYTTGSTLSACFDNIDTSMVSTAAIVNPNRACFSAYRSLAIAWIDPGTNKVTTSQDIIFDTEVFDTANAYNTSDGKFTAPYTGLYYFQAQHSLADWTGYNSFKERGRLFVNGAEAVILYNCNEVVSDWNSSTGQYVESVRTSVGSCMIHLTQNDYVQVKISMDWDYGGYNHNTLTGRANTFFQGYCAVRD